MILLRDLKKQARRSADPGEMIEADSRELGEGDGQEGKVNAGDIAAERQDANKGTESDAGNDREPDADPGTEAVVKIERACAIGADAEILGVAEGELAGETHHDVPGLAGVGEQEEERGQRKEIIVRERRQRDQRDGQQCQQE